MLLIIYQSIYCCIHNNDIFSRNYMVFHLLMLLILSNTHANKGLSIKMCANVYGNKCLLSNIIVHLKSEISLLLHERGYLNFTNETKRVQMCLDIIT